MPHLRCRRHNKRTMVLESRQVIHRVDGGKCDAQHLFHGKVAIEVKTMYITPLKRLPNGNYTIDQSRVPDEYLTQKSTPEERLLRNIFEDEQYHQKELAILDGTTSRFDHRGDPWGYGPEVQDEGSSFSERDRVDVAEQIHAGRYDDAQFAELDRKIDDPDSYGSDHA